MSKSLSTDETVVFKGLMKEAIRMYPGPLCTLLLFFNKMSIFVKFTKKSNIFFNSKRFRQIILSSSKG